MSANSRKKAPFLRKLSKSAAMRKKRVASRWVHEKVVTGLVDRLRSRGLRCYILSEYVKEERTPDAIIFDGKRLIAVEVEQERRYKPSRSAIRERLERLNSKPGFFDHTRVVFVPEGADPEELVERESAGLASKD